MMTFISCAKTMTTRSKTPYPETTTPHFLKEENLLIGATLNLRETEE